MASRPPSAGMRPPRQARSRATRGRIVDAATGLFLRDGYVDTTVGAIAAEAGVAVQSIYVGFGSKLGVLAAALDVAIVGDEEPVALLDRAWAAELAAIPGARQAVAHLVEHVGEVLLRTQPIYEVVRSAAATDAGQLLAENKRLRHEGLRTVAGLLAAKRGFATGLGADEAADVLYAVLSEESYGLLVVDRGWDPARWQRWAEAALVAALCRVSAAWG